MPCRIRHQLPSVLQRLFASFPAHTCLALPPFFSLYFVLWKALEQMVCSATNFSTWPRSFAGLLRLLSKAKQGVSEMAYMYRVLGRYLSPSPNGILFSGLLRTSSPSTPDFDQEPFVKGNSVVWRTVGTEVVRKSFTFPETVLQAVWATFDGDRYKFIHHTCQFTEILVGLISCSVTCGSEGVCTPSQDGSTRSVS